MDILKKTINWAMLMILAFTISFTSCSSDDEEGSENSSVKKCYIKIDGKQIDFKYAYYYGDEEGDMFEFTNLDMLYYYKNPDKIVKGLKFTWASIYDDMNFTSGTTTNYNFEYSPEEDLYANRMEDEEDRPLESYYCSPDEENTTPISITTHNGYYKIEANAMVLDFIDEKQGWEPIDQTTVDFYFEGTPQKFWIEPDTYVAVSRVDKPTMQWIKKMHRNK